ncbi:hypothetical protein DESC_740103 [Desulfosarcina cetonica]|nr:hypothetical protein DESC_740103 [Desulfosarcina cetonica]
MDRDRLVDIPAVADQIENRCKGFALNDAEVVFDFANRRLHVAPGGIRVAFEHLAAAEAFAALLDDLFEGLPVGFDGCAVDERSHVVLGIQWRTDAQVAVSLDQGCRQFVVDAFVNDNPARGGAPLAGRSHSAENDGRDRHGQIGGGGDDDGIVAAKLQNGASESTGHHLGGVTPHAGGAGYRDQGDARILDQPLPDGTAASHHQRKEALGDDIGIVAQNVGQDVLDGDGGKRRLGRGLPEDGVAAYGGQHGVPGPWGHREVERTNDADHPQGMILVVHAVIAPFRCHGESVKLPGLPQGKVTDIDHFLNFPPSFLEGFAHFVGNQRAQGLLEAAQLDTDLADDVTAFGRRDLAPLQKGGVRRRRHLVVFPFGGGENTGDGFPVHRRNHLDCIALLRSEPIQPGGNAPVFPFNSKWF